MSTRPSKSGGERAFGLSSARRAKWPSAACLRSTSGWGKRVLLNIHPEYRLAQFKTNFKGDRRDPPGNEEVCHVVVQL